MPKSQLLCDHVPFVNRTWKIQNLCTHWSTNFNVDIHWLNFQKRYGWLYAFIVWVKLSFIIWNNQLSFLFLYHGPNFTYVSPMHLGECWTIKHIKKFANPYESWIILKPTSIGYALVRIQRINTWDFSQNAGREIDHTWNTMLIKMHKMVPMAKAQAPRTTHNLVYLHESFFLGP
jgi:hypothetical protein